MKRRRPQPVRPAAPRPPRPVFPFAVTLRACALIFEGDGSPALYVCADDHGGVPRLYRVPNGVRVTVKAPHPLPDSARRVFLPHGSAATFQAADGRVSVLSLHTVRLCREVLEALEAHAQAVRTRGEEKGQGAA
ncbi:hypothetical protein [Deinococcus arcticus]|uniref:Uncharacterized protein n=1 Tax=Deinococcus arcticus TaxID=2136176 RepID=A0A2T3WAW8_9DEIO|nr:hypothetical protein [Deinococcus arcticus]PTA68987.1 hypothetical protein C8263_04090 [Deinococcus arcticus]